jgi:hypothetical protein
MHVSRRKTSQNRKHVFITKIHVRMREFLTRYARNCSLCVYTVYEDCEGLLSIFLKSRRMLHSMAVSLSGFPDSCALTAYLGGSVYDPNMFQIGFSPQIACTQCSPVRSRNSVVPRSFACFLLSSASNVALFLCRPCMLVMHV